MKVLMKPIEMIAWNTKKGILTPIRFRISSKELDGTVKKSDSDDDEDDIEKIVVHVGHPQYLGDEKYAGNRMLLYRCKSEIDGIEKVYELKYEINTCKWFLFKM